MIRTRGGWLDIKPCVMVTVAPDFYTAIPIPSYRIMGSGMGGVMRWDGLMGEQGEAPPTPQG